MSIAALISIGVDAIPALIDCLVDEEALVRSGSALTLGRIGSDAKEAIPILIDCLKDDDVTVRVNAAEALSVFGSDAMNATPALIECLTDNHLVLRKKIVEALVSIGIDAVPALTNCLVDKDSLVRSRSALALSAFGADANDAVPNLIEGLKDPDFLVVHDILRALGRMTLDSYESMSSMLKLVKSEGACDLVSELVNCLHAKDVSVRIGAINVVGIAPAIAADAIPALTECLRANDIMIRRNAIRVFGQFGDKALNSIPDLVKCLSDEDGLARQLTNVALSRIGTATLPFLIDAFANEESRAEVVFTLGLIGSGEKPTISVIEAALQDSNPVVRRRAARALEKIREINIDENKIN